MFKKSCQLRKGIISLRSRVLIAETSQAFYHLQTTRLPIITKSSNKILLMPLFLRLQTIINLLCETSTHLLILWQMVNCLKVSLSLNSLFSHLKRGISWRMKTSSNNVTLMNLIEGQIRSSEDLQRLLREKHHHKRSLSKRLTRITTCK